MITTFTSLFDSVILDQPAARAAFSAPAPGAEVRAGQAMPASLWRHTLTADVADARHRLVARRLFGVLAALGFGSVSYAAWQTWTLMSGNHLFDAVSALAR